MAQLISVALYSRWISFYCLFTYRWVLLKQKERMKQSDVFLVGRTDRLIDVVGRGRMRHGWRVERM